MANAVDPVVIEFALKGLPAVFRAFEQLSKVAAKAESEWARASTSSAQTRMRALLSETQQKARVAGRSASDAERAIAREEKAAERAAKAKIREADKAAKEAVRIEARKAKEVERILQRQRREEKRLVDWSINEERRAAAERANIRAKETKSRENRVDKVTSSSIRGLRRAGNLGMDVVRGVMEVGGGFSAADSVRRQVEAKGIAAQIVAGTSTENKAGLTTEGLLRTADVVGKESVLDRSQVLSGIGAFKDITGDTKRGMAISGSMGKLANATGADFSELMANAGEIAAKNKSMSNDDVIKLTRVQAAQGQAGAVELKDFAKFGSRTVAAASLFGGDKAGNIASASAMAQLARQHGSASSAAEATLSSLRLATDFAKKGDVLKEKFGVNVSDGKGQLRSQQGILTDIVKATKGDVVKLANSGIGERGNRVLQGAAAIYRDNGGGVKGEAALKAFFETMTKGLSDAEIEAAAKQRLSEVDKQLEQAMNDLRQSVGDALIPELQKLIPALREATPHIVNLMTKFAELAAWASRNPFGALAGAIIASITGEIAKAGIADLIKRLLMGGGGGGGAPGGMPPMPGVAGPAAIVGALGAGVLYNAGTSYADGSMGAEDLAARVRAYNTGNTAQGVSPEDARATLMAAHKRLGDTSAFAQAGNIITSPFSDTSSKNYKQFKSDQALVDSKDLIAALKENTKATRENSIKTPDGATAGNRTHPINSRGGAP